MRFEVNLSILFTELPLLERPAAAKQAGFDAVEFWWPWPVAVPVGRRDRPVRRARSPTPACSWSGLNFFAGDMPGGDRGLVSWPARSAEFRDNIDVTVGIGERLGCRAFNALYGNRTDDSTPDGAGRAGHREPRARGAGGAADRRHRARRAGQRRAPLPAAHRGGRAGRDRPGRARRTSRCCSTSTTWRSTATTSTPRSTPPRAGSGTCRSPTPRAATSPAPGSSTSTTTCERIAATGYDGWVGLEYKPTGASADAFDWLPREQRARLAEPHLPPDRKVLPT